MENFQHLINRHPDYLTTSEYSLLMKLTSLTSKNFNKLIDYKKSTGYGYTTELQAASISSIAQFINCSRANTSKTINSLIDKGFIIQEEENIIEDKNNRKVSSSPLFLNPELCYQGSRNNINGQLCRYIMNNDILEKNEIYLPWKVWVDKNKKNGRLFKRKTYMKKRSSGSN